MVGADLRFPLYLQLSLDDVIASEINTHVWHDLNRCWLHSFEKSPDAFVSINLPYCLR